VALAIWTAVKIGLLWLALRMVPRPRPLGTAYPAVLEFVFSFGFFPLFLDLFEGQDAILLLFLLTASLNQLQAGKNFSAGLLLALGLFKFHFVLPLVIILCLAKGARILGGFIAGAAALASVSLMITGPHALAAYPTYLLRLNRWSGAGFAWPHNMPNLRGLLSPISNLEWPAVLLSTIGIAVTICILRTAKQTGPSVVPLAFSLAVIAAVLTSYYAYSYDLTLLLLPLLLLSGGFLDAPGLAANARRWMVAGMLLLLCAPLEWLLVARFDCGYLMAVPALFVALGIAQYLRTAGHASAPAARPT
jgi:hypothetical protein